MPRSARQLLDRLYTRCAGDLPGSFRHLTDCHDCVNIGDVYHQKYAQALNGVEDMVSVP